MSSGKIILVAEDNDFVRMQICKFLQDEGHEIKECADGQEALANISNEISLAIVDVRMEPMSGFDFIRSIRGSDIKTPVILVTGDDSPDLLEEANKFGVIAVLKKPVQKERLIKIVSRTLHMER
ncbi:MAG: response regulator [Alphaproteobacteria bacterium]|nr:response regulator [Alphaproteobacteria bacterium]